MAKKAVIENVEESEVIPTCKDCKFYGDKHPTRPEFAECKLASMASQSMFITGHSGKLYTHNGICCSEIVDKE
jgi:predicted nucleic acid binding AN1-type Zn finger protein